MEFSYFFFRVSFLLISLCFFLETLILLSVGFSFPVFIDAQIPLVRE